MANRYQFSLRTLLLIIVVASLCLSWYAIRRERTRIQEPPAPAWRKYASYVALDGHGHVRAIHFASFNQARDEELKGLCQLVHLESLSLAGCAFTDRALACLEGLQKLRNLDVRQELDRSKLTDAGLSHLGGLTSLRELGYWGGPVTDSGLRHLEYLQNLERLRLGCLEATDEGLKSLAKLHQLENLALTNGERMTGEGLAALPAPEILQSLSIRRCTDAGMRTMTRFSNLRHLWIGGPDLTVDGLSRLPTFKKLETLWISETPLDTHALERFVSELPRLEELRLLECGVGEADLGPLRPVKQKGVTVSTQWPDDDENR